ncbi:MAG: MerR family transcriptional regulator [Coprobacillus cateniformis]|uniref:MerR family transcriptional regulator n=1 Tax=Longibaculum muris TaxID=1796628 RepID=UPI003AB14973|nr:MerR family transcriptional regulator [Coprobacillus cateniformis]
MKIKEVEKMLQMNLQTIRYYDKQDFLILKEMKMDIEIILWMISKHSKKYVF